MEDLRPNTTRVRTEPIKVGEVSGPVQEQAESGGNETNTQSSSVQPENSDSAGGEQSSGAAAATQNESQEAN